jgi:hypothetical protein
MSLGYIDLATTSGMVEIPPPELVTITDVIGPVEYVMKESALASVQLTFAFKFAAKL